jgi:DMSO reductase anchor subunit
MRPKALSTYKNTQTTITAFITVLILGSIGTRVFNKYTTNATMTKVIIREINVYHPIRQAWCPHLDDGIPPMLSIYHRLD